MSTKTEVRYSPDHFATEQRPGPQLSYTHGTIATEVQEVYFPLTDEGDDRTVRLHLVRHGKKVAIESAELLSGRKAKGWDIVRSFTDEARRRYQLMADAAAPRTTEPAPRHPSPMSPAIRKLYHLPGQDKRK